MFKTKSKKQVDDILDEVKKECYNEIDKSKASIDVLQLINSCLNKTPLTKSAVGLGFVMKNQVEFDLGGGQSVQLTTREYDDDED